MTEDIVTKISNKLPPSSIDRFYNDMQRRDQLTDIKIKEILQTVFSTIDPESLGSNDLEYQYQVIKGNLSV